MRHLLPSNKKAFFSMEALLGLLVVVVTVSWIIVIVWKSASVQESARYEDVALGHAEFILSNIQKAPLETLAHDIQKGIWNYPNGPAIAAAGLLVLPGEYIITECEGEGALRVTVTVRWRDISGEMREKAAEATFGG